MMIVVVHNVPISCLKQIAFSLDQQLVSKFIKAL